MLQVRWACALAAALLALSGCAGRYFHDAGAPPEPPRLELDAWPYRELWAAIVFNGNKIGFAHIQVTPAARPGEPHEIRTESAFRLRFLGFDKRMTLRSRDLVRGDLALEAFDYEYDIGEWTGVDATLGQLSTDATHLRILYGENPADLMPVAAWIGRTRIEVLERR